MIDLENVRKRINEASEGRAVKLVAVTKNLPVDAIKEAMKMGVDCIGENRIQEASEKFPKLPPVEKHMIGHLQTNKVKLAVQLFDCIQSVDSYKIAEEIGKRAYEEGKIMPVLIEVNIGGEESKFGVAPKDLSSFHDKVRGIGNIKVEGLMAMAPHLEPEKTRPYFKEMKELFDRENLKWLSMGMTNDYEIAIQEGSNMVRIGTAIFGKI